MKTTNANAIVIAADNKKSATTKARENAQPRENMYIARMQTNRDILTKNLSKLFKDCTTGTLIPRDVCAIDKSQFAEFRAYMCKRHECTDGQTPKRGWSVWYALQWCEQQVTKAADDANAPTHAKACAYKRQTRAQMQDAAKRYFVDK